MYDNYDRDDNDRDDNDRYDGPMFECDICGDHFYESEKCEYTGMDLCENCFDNRDRD